MRQRHGIHISLHNIIHVQSIRLSSIPNIYLVYTRTTLSTYKFFFFSLVKVFELFHLHAKASSFKECRSIMANSTWHVYGSIFVYLFVCFVCHNVITQTDSRPWYESLPAVAMDYKVHIDAGKEDCYYQYVQPGATFYVSFQVGFGKISGLLGLSDSVWRNRLMSFS